MKSQIVFALAHPVFDPDTQLLPRHFWRMGDYSFGLTVNIGMECAVYAGGRPLWQLSIACQGLRGPVPVLRWSPTMHRKAERERDRIMGMCGVEALIEPEGEEAALLRVTRQWRKPLSIEEIAQMADTPEVRERKGRP